MSLFLLIGLREQIIQRLKEKGYPTMRAMTPFSIFTISDFQTVDNSMVRYLWKVIFTKNDFLNLKTESMKIFFF